ncbi:uncharacterized protein A4U43_C04F25860, partial [Asparagus officinalis]
TCIVTGSLGGIEVELKDQVPDDYFSIPVLAVIFVTGPRRHLRLRLSGPRRHRRRLRLRLSDPRRRRRLRSLSSSSSSQALVLVFVSDPHRPRPRFLRPLHMVTTTDERERVGSDERGEEEDDAGPVLGDLVMDLARDVLPEPGHDLLLEGRESVHNRLHLHRNLPHFYLFIYYFYKKNSPFLSSSISSPGPAAFGFELVEALALWLVLLDFNGEAGKKNFLGHGVMCLRRWIMSWRKERSRRAETALRGLGPFYGVNGACDFN